VFPAKAHFDTVYKRSVFVKTKKKLQLKGGRGGEGVGRLNVLNRTLITCGRRPVNPSANKNCFLTKNVREKRHEVRTYTK